MARIIAIANQKGGVGKTTTAVNLAAALARAPQRVLLVDLDAQGNATMGSGVDKREVEASTCDVLLGEVEARAAVVTTAEGFDLMPGNIDLTAAEIQLMESDGREQRLKTALESLRGDYDFIIIDCPPALSLLTLNALTAADSVLVPMQCEYYALEGLSALMETIEALRARLNPGLEIERVAEAPSHGQSIVGYDRASRGGVAYLGLAGEILRRAADRKKQQQHMEHA